MAEHVITKSFSNEGTRNEVRLRVIKAFSKEVPGTGSGNNAERYTYYVETLSNGDRVYLRRPANLHNGFDFLVCVENFNYAQEGRRMRNYPKHEDIQKDLEFKKEANIEEYRKLYNLLKTVFECHDVTDEMINEINFDDGLPVDHIVKTVKWLFIEQDVRYWNYSGRNLTWGIIPEI